MSEPSRATQCWWGSHETGCVANCCMAIEILWIRKKVDFGGSNAGTTTFMHGLFPAKKITLCWNETKKRTLQEENMRRQSRQIEMTAFFCAKQKSSSIINRGA